MLLVVTIGLVVVAAVTLTIGFANNQPRPVELSILCSCVAGVVLIFCARLKTRRSAMVTTATGPAPLPEGRPAIVIFDSDPAGVARAAEPPTPAPPPKAGTASAGAGMDDNQRDGALGLLSFDSIDFGEDDEDYEDYEDDWDDGEAVFPIEDYDDLRVAEIIPLLFELDDEELEVVRVRELAGLGRASIVTLIDQIVAGEQHEQYERREHHERREDHERRTTAARFTPVHRPTRPSRTAPPAGWAGRTTGSGRSTPPAWTEPEPEPQPQPAPVADRGAGPTLFPIADYDELAVTDILPLLAELEPEELELVAARERPGANRATILGRIDRLQRAGQQDPAGSEVPGNVAARAARR